MFGLLYMDTHVRFTVFFSISAASLCEAMKKQRETPIVQDIGDVMLARVSLLTSFTFHHLIYIFMTMFL